jgi:hypothetical protein
MMFPNFGNFPAMSDYQLVYQPFRNSWHRSSSQAWNPARVTNHDFGSYLFPQCGAQGSFAKLGGSGGRGCVHSLFRHRARALCQGHWGTGKGVGGERGVGGWVRRNSRVFGDEQRKLFVHVWKVRVFLTRFRTPHSFWYVTSFSNATFVFNTSIDRMQLLPCSQGVPTSFYKLIVTCLSKNVSGDYSSLL